MREADRHELAQVFLAKARGDRAGLATLLQAADVPDHVLGFLAQQAVEKAFKAVLTERGTAFGRRHDLEYLGELLGEHEPPDRASRDGASSLTPWAVEMRYELPEPPALNRGETLELVDSIIAWAETQVGA